jgi:hypothetical protein
MAAMQIPDSDYLFTAGEFRYRSFAAHFSFSQNLSSFFCILELAGGLPGHTHIPLIFLKQWWIQRKFSQITTGVPAPVLTFLTGFILFLPCFNNIGKLIFVNVPKRFAIIKEIQGLKCLLRKNNHLSEIARVRREVGDNPVNVHHVAIVPGVVPPGSEEQDQREGEPADKQKRYRNKQIRHHFFSFLFCSLSFPAIQK